MPQWVALLLSIGVEAAVAAALIGWRGWGSPTRAALAAALATLATHWLAWEAALRLMEPLGYAAMLLLVEAGVVAGETVAYVTLARLTAARALCASAIANASSAMLGVALNAVIAV